MFLPHRRKHHRNPFNFGGALVLEWKLENNLLDTSGNGYNGTAPNGVSYLTGAVGIGADLEYSTPQYITSALSALTPPYAFSFHVMMHRTATTEIIADWGDFVILTDTSTYFRVTNQSTVSVDNKYFEFSSLTWYHVAVNVNSATGGDLNLYVDNVEKTTVVAGNPNGSASAFQVGIRGDNTFPFDGKVDQVRIYNRVLTTDEIAALYGEN